MHGLSEGQVETVRAAISEGIIARALATGTTIVTASAADDPRFRDRESVQLGRIDAVICAPSGSSPPLGVLYLQGRVEPGVFQEAHVFPDAPNGTSDREPPRTFQDATRGFQARLVRETLEDSGWNVVEAARRLDTPARISTI